MGSAREQQLLEVEAVRQARLEAEQWRFQLEKARNELLHKETELGQLRQRLASLATRQEADGTVRGPAAAEQVELAKLEAAGYKYKLGITELELAKQLDALRELQWRLDSVVSQLGIEQRQPGLGAAASTQQGHAADEDEDLINKIGELMTAQQHADDYHRQLLASKAQAAQLKQQQQGTTGVHECLPALYTVEGVRHMMHSAGMHLQQPQAVASAGKELVDALLRENEELHGRLAHEEEKSQQLERDLDAELLMRSEHAGMPVQPKSSAMPTPALHPAQQEEASMCDSMARPCRHAAPRAALGDAVQRPAVSQFMEHLARRRLELRLKEKDRAMAKLRGVIKELEGKLGEAYKRQADWAMRESSWQEQVAQDRQLQALEEDRRQLAERLDAALADAEAARRDAAVQRRLARRPTPRAAEEDGARDKQMVDLLHKRVKILEAQNIKLRLAKSAVDNVQPGKADGSRRQSSSSGPDSESSRAGADDTLASGEGAPERPEAGTGSGENRAPNCSETAGDEAAAPPGSTGARAARVCSMLDGNPVLEKWEADKRLQRKVEGLKSKLQEKAQQLASSHATRERLGQQLQQMQAELTATQAAIKKLQQAKPTSLQAGPVIPPTIKEQLARLDDLQQRHDALERKLATLEQLAPRPPSPSNAACNPGVADPPGGGAAATVAGGSRPYRASDYGGRPEVAWEALEAQLLEKDVKLFDLTLERDQAVAQVQRLQQRVEGLLERLGEEEGPAAKAHAAAAAATASGGSKKRPTAREQELLGTVALLKSALECTKKGLKSGVSNRQYMAAVDKARQLKAQVSQLEAAVGEAAKVKEEAARLQQQLGQLHATNSALKSQLHAAKQRQEDAAQAREGAMNAQLAQLERALQERDTQLLQASQSMQQYDEEIRVLLEEGLHPAALVQELLLLRPRLRELEEQNAGLQEELAAIDAQVLQGLEQLKAEHEVLRSQSQRYESFIRETCARHNEPLPLGISERQALGCAGGATPDVHA